MKSESLINEIEKKLWNSADQLRANSKLKSSEYSIPVLGLIFLRYADHKFSIAKKEIEKRQKDSGSRRTIGRADYQAQGVLYLPESSRFKTLLNLPEGENIGRAINDAMREIEAVNEDLRDVIPKTYNRLENDVLVTLLKIFSSIPMNIEGDVFGKIYAYFLGKFAMAEGQRGGEFFTPTSLVNLILKLLNRFMEGFMTLPVVLEVCLSRVQGLLKGTKRIQALKSPFMARKRWRRPLGFVR